GCQKVAGGRLVRRSLGEGGSAAKTSGKEQNQRAPWKGARMLANGAHTCAGGPLAPFQGAISYCALTGGLRFASTLGYSLSTLRVEEPGLRQWRRFRTVWSARK